MEPLPVPVRHAVTLYMHHLFEHAGLSEIWFDAVGLLDVFCLHYPGGVQVGDLPATCAAVTSVLAKSKCGLDARVVNRLSLHAAAELAKWLLTQGHEVPEP